MRIQLTALAMAVILPFTAAQAADKPESKRSQQWTKELNLSAEQVQQFEHKNEAFHGEQKERFEQFREQQNKLREDFQTNQQTLRKQHHGELRNLLSPEQQATFDQRLEKMEKRHEKRAARFNRADGKKFQRKGDCTSKNQEKPVRRDLQKQKKMAED